MFKDHFSGHAADYASHRPTYPSALFDYLAGLPNRTQIAWDCATGNGQAAAELATHFDQVIATDASKEQIENATNLPDNVDTRVAPAEASGFEDGSVDLITVAQALHWFDFEAFFAEAKRVLAPGGVLAVWSYALTRISPEVDAIVDDFYAGEIDEYWPAEREHVENGYSQIEFPFAPIGVPDFAMQVEWTADHLLNYLSTWSSVRRFIAARGGDPVGTIAADLTNAFGEGSRTVSWPINLKVRRTG